MLRDRIPTGHQNMEGKSPGGFVQCPVCRKSHLPTSEVFRNGFFASTCPDCGHFFKFKATGPLKSSVSFTINGTSYTVGNQYAAALSLIEFMRRQGVSYGTKSMCIEGGCGVCLVTTTLYDPISKAVQTYTVNSCLLPLYTCDGMQVTTIEGLGNPRDGLHPIQDRLAQYNGSQCGFCSPAQVMNMYGLLKRTPKPTMQQVEDNFDGSICRCTGYRSILDAMKSFASDAPTELPGGPIDIEVHYCHRRKTPPFHLGIGLELDKKICSKTGQACTGRCSTKNGQLDNVPLHMVLQGAQWYKPTTRQELYSLLGQHKGDNYRLVFGNSGFGVYKEIGPWMYGVLIDLRGIQELYSISVDPNSQVMFGANVSLTNLLETFEKYSGQTTLPYFRDFAHHFSVIANTGVRNLASWAGNLILKNMHTEFPSDIFTMFEAVGAKVFIGSNDGTEKQYSLTDFLTLDMKGKVILSVVLPVYSTGDVYVKSYKITPRHQNAHAYVNAAFVMQLDRNNNFTVKSKPSLVYGGINKTLVHAGTTEAYLVGKQLGDPAVLKAAIASLSGELVPDSTAGLSSTAYRKNLAISLFYKAVLGMCGEKAAATYRSGGTDLMRPLSSGTQSYDTHKDEWPLTEPMTKKDAQLQTSGRVQFIDDVPPRPGELYASFVISTTGNAEIDTVDTSAALAYPGVVKYISVSDIPAGGVNNSSSSETVEEAYAASSAKIAWKRVRDGPASNAIFALRASYAMIFCTGKVLYSGQPIGLIVAVDKLTADTGASMVKVTYKNQQPPIIDVQGAIKKGTPLPAVATELKIGNAAAAIANSDKKISGTVSMGHQYHFHLETQTSVCYPAEDEVGMTILSSAQWADLVQQLVARFISVPESSINVQVRRLGGAFGAKITRSPLTACACALAAQILRRPVRLVMNFHTNMKTIGGRFPNLAEYEVGFSNDGKLNGIKMTVNEDCGATSNDSAFRYIAKYIDNVYHCPAWDFNPVVWQTNLPTNTACRSPASVESIFIMETMMEHVAKSLNKDPLEVKKLNMYTQGQKTPLGMVLQYCDIKDMVAQLETSAGVAARKQQIAAFNTANRWKKRGLSVMPLRWNLNLINSRFTVFMTIYHGDGSVAIAIGGVEVGQGINLKMMQVAAYELGIPMDTIKVKPMTTLANANSKTTGGSKTTDTNALGVIQCCNQLKARMAPVKAKMSNPTWKQVVAQCFAEGVDLSASALTNPTDIKYNYNIYGVTCTEVELDVLTGENQINRVDMLYDCGESFNPEIDIGQAEGAFVMGLGYWLTEEMIYDPKTGTNLTDGTWEYKPPLGKDIPIDFRISFMKNHPNQRGILGSKAVGEPPLCMAASALFAIKHAIEAARKDAAKDTFFPLNGPATVENIRMSCQVNTSQLVYGT